MYRPFYFKLTTNYMYTNTINIEANRTVIIIIMNLIIKISNMPRDTIIENKTK